MILPARYRSSVEVAAQHGHAPAVRLLAEHAASKARRRVKAGPRVAEEKAQTEAERRHRAKVYRLVDERSGGTCEVAWIAGAFCSGLASEHDHFFGRGKAKETAENVWHLCAFHHREKTDNKPNRRQWLAWFIAHCYRHAYRAELMKAERAMALEIAQHPPKSTTETA